jgi:hypothetical protein
MERSQGRLRFAGAGGKRPSAAESPSRRWRVILVVPILLFGMGTSVATFSVGMMTLTCSASQRRPVPGLCRLGLGRKS